jgi:hypothetical protein
MRLIRGYRAISPILQWICTGFSLNPIVVRAML